MEKIVKTGVIAEHFKLFGRESIWGYYVFGQTIDGTLYFHETGTLTTDEQARKQAELVLGTYIIPGGPWSKGSLG
jgi:hypothetical protein